MSQHINFIAPFNYAFANPEVNKFDLVRLSIVEDVLRLDISVAYFVFVQIN